MTLSCADVRPQAAGLAALAPDDPERQAAYAHARTCAACAAALADAEAVLVLVDQALPLAAPSDAALAQARRAVEAEMDKEADKEADKPADEEARRRPLAVPALAADRRAVGSARLSRARLATVLATLALSWLAPMAKRLSAGAPALVSAGLALAVAVAAATALTWGGPALAGLPVLSLVLSLAGGGDAGLQATLGAKCMLFELVLAAAPLAITFLFARTGRFGRPVFAVAAVAAGGALMGQAVLHVTCHALPSTSHGLVFHTIPVLLALGIGALAGGRAAASAARNSRTTP